MSNLIYTMIKGNIVLLIISCFILADSAITQNQTNAVKSIKYIDQSIDNKTNNIGHFSTDPNNLCQINPTNGFKDSKSITNENRCDSNVCKIEAVRLLYYLDYSNGYDNFYDFAIGGVSKNKHFQDLDPKETNYKLIKEKIDQLNNGSTLAEKNLKIFYESCMDFEKLSFESKISRGKKIVQLLGLKYVNETENINITDTIITMIQLDSFPVYDIDFEYDKDKLTEIRLIYPNKDLFNLVNKFRMENCFSYTENNDQINISRNDYYNSYRNCMKEYFGSTEYRNEMKEALLAISFLPENWNSSIIIDKIIADVNDVLVPILKEKYEPFSDNTEYFSIPQSTNDLNKLKTKLNENFNYLFNKLFNKNVNNNANVYYYLGLARIMTSKYMQNKQKLNNALIAHLTFNIYKYLVKTEAKNNERYREKFCIDFILRHIPDIVSNLLMKSIKDEKMDEQIVEAERINKLIHTTLKEEVQKQGMKDKSERWLEAEAISSINKKIENFKLIFPPKLLKFNSSDTFDKVPIDSNSFLINAIKLIRRNRMLTLSFYNTTFPEEAIWLLYLNTFSKESEYIYKINSLAIPAPILLEYNKELPDGINMARLGYAIASGYARAFDFNEISDKHDTKTLTYKRILRAMNEAVDNIKFIKDDKTYNIMITGVIEKDKAHNTDLVKREKLSDLTATKLAFETLKKYGNATVLTWGDFNKEQLFFITLAQKQISKLDIKEWYLNIFEGKSYPSFIRAYYIFNNIHISKDLLSLFPKLNIPKFKNETIISPFPYFEKNKDGINESYE